MKVQKKAELLGEKTFLGVPVVDFEKGGREQLIYLLAAGMYPDSKVIDLGCGVLRAGYWLIHFLDPLCYCGIEPHSQRLAMGVNTILEREILDHKRPRFDSNANFDTSVFGEKFDFFLAYSIWTHASKRQIQLMLDGFLRDSKDNARYLTTYLPATAENPDHRGEVWTGTSHESDVPGVVHHSRSWIDGECDRRGLVVRDLGLDKTHGQSWLEIERRSGPRPTPYRDLARPDLVFVHATGTDSLPPMANQSDEIQRALRDALTQLDDLKRSRLLKIGRVLRRMAGRPVPY